MSQTTQTQQLTAADILKTLQENRLQLKELGVRKLGLFGSYQQGTASLDSDMDFLVEFEQPTFDAYMDTKFFLEDLFHCKVDLVVIEANIKPRLRAYILDEVSYVSGLEVV